MIRTEIYFLTLLCLANFALWAGDDPCTATNLSTTSTDFSVYDNFGNSDSGIDAPPLGGYAGSDIWFSFTMPAGEVSLLLQSGSMTDPALAIYAGDCSDPLIIYNVIDNNCDDSPSPELLISDLNPGEEYLIRVWSQDGGASGTFGLFLGTDVPTLLNFEVFDDASIIGDCIELTPEQDGQHGCAWYQLEVDFSQPFTHEMLANFGDNSFNGADGICLVYQSNGPDYCGSTGAGIGAEGMPNSAIFEFDTYQNGGPYADPFFDHVSFNVNGNMTHPASINGPETLFPNIEDGDDHTILFDWNPAGNLYELYFDGELVLSGSYDIINNCFGGNNLAYWGYTASTGALNNNHVICPLNVEYTPATVAYEEITICADESYNGWTEEGFYIREETGTNGCIHQIHTRLFIAPESVPYELEKFICDGEIFEVEGEFFFEEGQYTINTFTDLGCDSTILLDLKVITPLLEIVGSETFNCNLDTIILTLDLDVNYPIVDVDYFWLTPDGPIQSDSIIATKPGVYRVNTFINYEDVLCQVSARIDLFIDTIPPVISDISDLTILCNTPVEDRILVAPEDQDSLYFTWYLNNSLVGNGDTLSVDTEGTYTLVATDTLNGCIDTTQANVNIDGDIPLISFDSDTLTIDCNTTEFVVTPTVIYQMPGTIEWKYNDSFLTNDLAINLNSPGIYRLEILDVNGCFTSDSIRVLVDTIAPEIIVSDIIVPCDVAFTNINMVSNTPNTIAMWNGPEVLSDILNPTISTSGTYNVIVTDTTNFCLSRDTFTVDILGPSPNITLEGAALLNCNNETATLLANANQSDVSFNWFNNEEDLLSTNNELVVSNEGTFFIEVNSVSGCATIDSILIAQNFLYPTLTLISDTLDCDNLSATIDATIIDGTIAGWVTPDGSEPTTSSLTTSVAGTYILNTLNVESGCETIDSIEVVDNSNPPIYNFASSTINCTNTSVELDLEILSNYENVTWTFPNSSTTSEINPTTSFDGLYNLHIEVEGSCDLDTIIQIDIDTIPPNFDVEFGTLDCTNQTTFFNLTNSENISSLIITSPSNELYTDLFNTVNEGGIYSINTINDNGCITTDSAEIISFITIPEIEIEQDFFVSCNSPNAMISASSLNPDMNYSWSDEQSNTLGTTNSIMVNSGGLYLLEIQDENGCENIYSVTIDDLLALPEINLMADSITCNNPIANITIQSNDVLTTLEWTNSVEIISNEIEVEVDESGWYYLQATNQYGCMNSDSVVVEEWTDSPIIELVSQDTIVLEINGQEPIIVNEVTSNNISYEWIPSEGLSCDDCISPIVEEYVNDLYQLTVTDINGCISTLDVHVRVKKLTEVYIPNIFSASNGDGNNDRFTLYANENVEIINEMYIYDRWGNLVFSNTNFAPNDPSYGWDGTFKNSLAVNGVYVYLFKVSTTEGVILNFTGDVTKI